MRNRKGNKMKKWLTLFIMICAVTMLFALTVNGADIRPSVTLEDGTKITAQVITRNRIEKVHIALGSEEKEK